LNPIDPLPIRFKNALPFHRGARGVTMPQPAQDADEALKATFAAVAENRSREIALRAVAAAARYQGQSLTDLMKESERMAAALRAPQTK
jgi:hypothetical protein